MNQSSFLINLVGKYCTKALANLYQTLIKNHNFYLIFLFKLIASYRIEKIAFSRHSRFYLSLKNDTKLYPSII